jgi:hypothetical protein
VKVCAGMNGLRIQSISYPCVTLPFTVMKLVDVKYITKMYVLMYFVSELRRRLYLVISMC